MPIIKWIQSLLRPEKEVSWAEISLMRFNTFVPMIDWGNENEEKEETNTREMYPFELYQVIESPNIDEQ